MLFNYKAITNTGGKTEGTIESANVDVAINLLQKRGLMISEIHEPQESKLKFDIGTLPFFNRVSNKDVVVLSRQMATLFQAQVSALRIFRLIGSESDNLTLKKILMQVSDDIQGGSSISNALSKHPSVFSDFYVNMVRAGEESGKLDETFSYLADYLDRTYEVTSKAKNALVYPAFVVVTFVAVMILMLTVIIPKISLMLTESGQEVPIYTKIVLGLSSIFVNYGIFIALGAILAGFFIWKYNQTEEGAMNIDKIRLDIPFLGDLYRKLFLSRISDNLNTMITSGIPILRALEITSAVVDNRVYKAILNQALIDVKGGSSLSSAFEAHPEIPGIMVQMVKVGEETGEVGNILKTLAKFYQREVTGAIDTLVGLIEPVMIVALGLGVGVLLAAVLMPIYNIAGAA
jgi:type IV pilus assembly protein PilC